MNVLSHTSPAPVLVVDMDRTLLRVDTLHETLLALIAAQPWRLPSVLGWLRLGKAEFKRRLADEIVLAAEHLPMNEAVLDLIRQARADGRRVVLVSAAEQRQVDAVAGHLGLFDDAHGTGAGPCRGVNIGGRTKARFLVERFGERGFDYVGDAVADLPVWAAARHAMTVRASASLRAAVERTRSDAEHLDPSAALRNASDYLRALRPHQWLKNLLVFMPVVAAHDMAALAPAAIAFIAFCLTASSVYLINDLVDLRVDRAHPRKRNRPLAAGRMQATHALAFAALLVALAAALSLLVLPPLFLGVLCLYCVSTFAYSLVLKRQLILDVWTLAGLYTLRVLAGAAAAGVPLSFWMLAFSMFLFLSLAAVKRQAELTSQLSEGWSLGSGRAYRTEDLPILQGMALSAGYAAVVVFALYVNSPDVRGLYESPSLLWFVCPLLLYWLSRMVMVTHRGGMTDDPIVFAVRDPVSLAVLAASALVVFAAGVL